ncbi:MAG: hypothetical protein ABSH36_11225 [Solirubrobacteraceae bacterium]
MLTATLHLGMNMVGWRDAGPVVHGEKLVRVAGIDEPELRRRLGARSRG